MADLSISQIIQESLVQEAAVTSVPFNQSLVPSDKKPSLRTRLTDAYVNTKNKITAGGKAALDHVSKHKLAYGAGAGALTAAGAGTAAYLHHRSKQAAASRRNKAIAGASLAAIGAGVGAKALMKYLKKKKKG